MKILYAARYARMDLLRAVCVLAQNVSKWTRDCDVKLYRLICYINCSLHVRMTGWIGDNIDDLTVDLFADADFAGCTKTSRSTSGTHLSILGPNSCWPIAGQSKKQGCVSHSTPEAELVSADHAVRTYGTPALDLWSVLLHRPMLCLNFHEDNETAISVMRTGHSQALRHIERTHGINLRALHERFKEPWYNLAYQRSALMSADIYTKGFAEAAAWQLATRLINHLDPDLFWGGRRMSKALVMPTEHEGGLTFDFWVSSPWLNHTIRPKPAAPGLAPGEQAQVTPTTTAVGTMAAAAVAADDDSVMEDKDAKTTCK